MRKLEVFTFTCQKQIIIVSKMIEVTSKAVPFNIQSKIAKERNTYKAGLKTCSETVYGTGFILGL